MKNQCILTPLILQVLMNNPLFAGNPQLQEQFRSHMPVFLQQVKSTAAATFTLIDAMHQVHGWITACYGF